MWLGEQIDEYGIGNGISLLIMAGILARMPSAGLDLIKPMLENGFELGNSGGQFGVETLLVLAVCSWPSWPVWSSSPRGSGVSPPRAPSTSAGAEFTAGPASILPLRVNQAGVMPIIFASSLLLFPTVGFGWVAKWFDPNTQFGKIVDSLANVFRNNGGFVYNIMYIGLIYFFCYFWTAITFNPKDMADNLKNYGTFIPGYRPGKRTADYLEKVMVRITYVGAGFLALVAVIPTLVAAWLKIPYSVAGFYGGTGLLIAVSVAFDLVQKIDSHLVMRNYKGLLE
jgi:preprotein translocase subunit SecY